MDFTIIAAIDQNRGIGKDNDLSWHLSADLKHFAATTKGGTVIMGRNTWESIPEKYKPFKERLNIVLTRGKPWVLGLPDGVLYASDLDTALGLSYTEDPDKEIFVIGGGMVYELAIEHQNCKRILLTELEQTFECDRFFPEIPEHFKKTDESELMEEKGIEFKFVSYSA